MKFLLDVLFSKDVREMLAYVAMVKSLGLIDEC